MRVQGVLDPRDKAYPEQYRRMAAAVNSKSRSLTTIYLRVVAGVALPTQIFRSVVGTDTTLIVKAASGVCINAGAGGAVGTTLRLAGGSATLDLNFFPVAATQTDLGAGTLNNYQVPGSKIFTVTLQADDHTGPVPSDIMIALDCLYL